MAKLPEQGIEILPSDLTVLVFVKTIEHNLELFQFTIAFFKLNNHHAYKLIEVNSAILFVVNFLDHLCDF